MANHASAEKRNRQRVKRTTRNRAAKSALRTAMKQARATLTSTPKDAAAAVREAVGALDRAAKKGIVPTARANRLKSRLGLALAKA